MQKYKIIGYLIGVGHEKQVTIGYQYHLKKSISCIPNKYLYLSYITGT